MKEPKSFAVFDGDDEEADFIGTWGNARSSSASQGITPAGASSRCQNDLAQKYSTPRTWKGTDGTRRDSITEPPMMDSPLEYVLLRCGSISGSSNLSFYVGLQNQRNV